MDLGFVPVMLLIAFPNRVNPNTNCTKVVQNRDRKALGAWVSTQGKSAKKGLKMRLIGSFIL
jgi:hypothetical protein